MTTLTATTLLGRLSHELIFMCDDGLIVREANGLALETLDRPLVGLPFAKLFATNARVKGEAFLGELRQLSPNEITVTWELMLHVPHQAPLLIGLRAGALEGGGWVIMGGGEPTGMHRLYHEVLALNTELTDLVRKLTREQAALSEQVRRLLAHQEKQSHAAID
ncbi:MAG: hypothetical protein AB4911_18840 [Oscillochloridaceae bacterium umkhey_bin13]